jgi:hypothetical protein
MRFTLNRPIETKCISRHDTPAGTPPASVAVGDVCRVTAIEMGNSSTNLTLEGYEGHYNSVHFDLDLEPLITLYQHIYFLPGKGIYLKSID